jgi:hypothetical protein
VALAVPLALSCSDSGSSGVNGQPSPSSGSGGAGLTEELPPDDECAGIDCLPCARTRKRCASSEEFLPGTCCAQGDPLIHLANGSGAEVVDIETDGRFTITCGGFGAQVDNMEDPNTPRPIGNESSRCQRIAFGATPTDGTTIFYLTHHGDSWIDVPFLGTYLVDDSGQTTGQVATQSEPGVLYEGMDWKDNHLYVAAHAGGLRVYSTDPQGIPSYLTSLGGMGNAWELTIEGNFAYVVDNALGLHVVDISNPTSPSIVQTVATTGNPRDVAFDADRIYVALGGSGVDVFDATTPDQLSLLSNIDVFGSAQAVEASDGAIAVAAWNHVAVYDADTLLLVATEKLRAYPSFEQDLGIAMSGDTIFVGEWEGTHVLRYRHGHVAPDLWLDEQMFQFDPNKVDARAVIVRNRGRRTLNLDSISTSNLAFTSDKAQLAIAPGGGDYIELLYTPPGPTEGQSFLQLGTNDPDPTDADYKAALITTDSGALNVGDTIGDEFSFLDPNGASQLEGLNGKVVVLAYFALF